MSQVRVCRRHGGARGVPKRMSDISLRKTAIDTEPRLNFDGGSNPHFSQVRILLRNLLRTGGSVLSFGTPLCTKVRFNFTVSSRVAFKAAGGIPYGLCRSPDTVPCHVLPKNCFFRITAHGAQRLRRPYGTVDCENEIITLPVIGQNGE